MRAWYPLFAHAPEFSRCDVVCLSTVAIMTSHNDKKAGLSSCVAVCSSYIFFYYGCQACCLSLVRGEHCFDKLGLPFQQFVQGTSVGSKWSFGSASGRRHCSISHLRKVQYEGTVLERALTDLESFKETARLALEHCTSTLNSHETASHGQKRRKQTSGEVGMSPDTLREQPLSKVARNGLHGVL